MQLVFKVNYGSRSFRSTTIYIIHLYNYVYGIQLHTTGSHLLGNPKKRSPFERTWVEKLRKRRHAKGCKLVVVLMIHQLGQVLRLAKPTPACAHPYIGKSSRAVRAIALRKKTKKMYIKK